MKDKIKYTKIVETFGSIKQYKLFAVKSSHSLIPFTASFDRIVASKFCYLTDFVADPNQFSAHFAVMYALLSKEENVHSCIMENKTTSYSDQVSLTSNKEKNLPFQTISMFEDVLYLFNKDGFKIFKTNLNYYDYLIFVFADKEKNLEPYIEPIFKYEPYKTIDLSYLLNQNEGKESKNIFEFLKNCFCKLEISITDYNRSKLSKRLGKNNKIPKENILFPLKLEIGDEIYNKLTQNVNDDYLNFLTQEVDSL